MLFIISPAKKLDDSPKLPDFPFTTPDFQEDTEILVKQLASMNMAEVGRLMGISAKLAELNFQRYQDFSFPLSLDNALPAMYSFKGDVYQSLEVEKYQAEELNYAQNHLRILSGLYGLLRPMDLMHAYRLEMGTRLQNERGKNLYEFWGEKITDAINAQIQASGSKYLINLASKEYFKSVKPKQIEVPIITPQFKEDRGGDLKTIFLFAKQARGSMCDYAIQHKVETLEELKAFNGMGYRYQEEYSTEFEWVFAR